MPPPLALALCTGFVLWLLWLERTQSKDVSAAAWIPTIWFMAILSKPLGTWFGTTGSNEAGSPLDRMFLAALTVAALAVLIRRRFNGASALGSQWALLALLGYMIVSALWSDIPGIAVRRWVRESIVVVMALVLVSEPHPKKAVESLFRRSAYILMPFSLLLIKYYPALGVDYASWSGLQMWVGVSIHKNALSIVCMIMAFYLLWALYGRWHHAGSLRMGRTGWADTVILLLGLYLLRGAEGAYSAASVATTALGVLAFAGLVWLRRIGAAVPWVLVLSLLVAVTGFGASAPVLDGANVAIFSSSLGRDATLTGRTDTWAELLPVVAGRPMLGHGFGSFWTTERRDFYQMSHGHNGYLDVLLELGFIGLLLWIGWLVSCARTLQRSLLRDYEWACLGICLLLMAAIHNTAESDFSGLAGGFTAAVVFVTWASACGESPKSYRPEMAMGGSPRRKRFASRARERRRLLAFQSGGPSVRRPGWS
ncbi:MAG TPA: O-antigen ligase family protein [Vicinamibacterales bacterium]|nr:O-antigen ligase family protein [Vicinamibacterales bacterium]